MELHNFVPQVLLEDKDYKIFLDVVHRIFNDIHGLISKVPELIDVDNVSDIFLPKLAELVKYNLRYDLDISYQREIIKRLLTIYRARGSNDEIIMAATYGDYDYWVGAHVFYPDAKIDRQKAEIVDPVNEELFRHSKSAFSGTDKYPGSTMYREGTIIIKITYINDKIREAIKKVVPAGIRIYYYLIFDTSNEYGFVVDYGSWVIENETILEIQLNNMKPKPARRSDPTGARSSIYVFDGTKGWVTSFFTSFLLIEPNQADYNVANIGNKYAGESFDYSEVEIEVTQFRNDFNRDSFEVDCSNEEVFSTVTDVTFELTDMILKPASRSDSNGARSSLFTFDGTKVKPRSS